MNSIGVKNNKLIGTINADNSLHGTLSSNSLKGQVASGGTYTETKNYEDLTNKPQINEVELMGNKSFEDLGSSKLTNIEIDNIINSIV